MCQAFWKYSATRTANAMNSNGKRALTIAEAGLLLLLYCTAVVVTFFFVETSPPCISSSFLGREDKRITRSNQEREVDENRAQCHFKTLPQNRQCSTFGAFPGQYCYVQSPQNLL